jgi:GT2 family glycosyltransferase
LAVEANDIDYCLRLRKAGLRVLYDPYCTLYHFESKSRGQTGGDPERLRRAESELQTLRRRWGEDLETDPFYNRHFDRTSRPFTRLGPPPTGRAAISGG